MLQYAQQESADRRVSSRDDIVQATAVERFHCMAKPGVRILERDEGVGPVELRTDAVEPAARDFARIRITGDSDWPRIMISPEVGLS